MLVRQRPQQEASFSPLAIVANHNVGSAPAEECKTIRCLKTLPWPPFPPPRTGSSGIGAISTWDGIFPVPVPVVCTVFIFPVKAAGETPWQTATKQEKVIFH